MEGLRQEALYLACPGDCQAVFLGQLVHAQDGDNFLQRLVALQNTLNFTGDSVVLIANRPRFQDTAGGIERIDCWVNA